MVIVLIAGGAAVGGAGGGGGGGTLWQPLSTAAASAAPSAKRRPARGCCAPVLRADVVIRRLRIESVRMWVVYLNMLLALALEIFIVWWTLGGKLRRGKRKSGEGPPSEKQRDDASDGR